MQIQFVVANSKLKTEFIFVPDLVPFYRFISTPCAFLSFKHRISQKGELMRERQLCVGGNGVGRNG
jgi:hypothetical protein